LQPQSNDAKKIAAAEARRLPIDARMSFEVRDAIRRAASGDLVRHVVVPFAVQRTILFAVVAYAHSRLPSAYAPWMMLPDSALDAWFRWDSSYYLRIASDGYAELRLFRHSPLAGFFPGYPWAVHLVAIVAPLWMAALFVSNVALLAALCCSFLIGRRVFGEAVAQRSVWLALAFPTAFFWSAAYSDSLYFATCAGAVLAAQSRRPWIAALCVAYATVTRPMGVVCMTLPFWIGWLARGRSRERAPWFTAGSIVGIGLLVLVHAISTGDPFEFLKSGVYNAYGRATGLPDMAWWPAIRNQGVGAWLMLRLMNWSALVLAVVAAVALWRRKHFEFAVLTLMSVLVPLAIQRTLLEATSMARYILAGFPLFFCLASWTPARDSGTALEVFCSMLQVLLAYLFGAWVWIE
jgi:hypothetical protein